MPLSTLTSFDAVLRCLTDAVSKRSVQRLRIEKLNFALSDIELLNPQFSMVVNGLAT